MLEYQIKSLLIPALWFQLVGGKLGKCTHICRTIALVSFIKDDVRWKSQNECSWEHQLNINRKKKIKIKTKVQSKGLWLFREVAIFRLPCISHVIMMNKRTNKTALKTSQSVKLINEHCFVVSHSNTRLSKIWDVKYTDNTAVSNLVHFKPWLPSKKTICVLEHS